MGHGLHPLEPRAHNPCWSTWVEGRSIEPVWSPLRDYLGGRTGWLDLFLLKPTRIDVIKSASALANKAITIQVYSRGAWRTVLQGVMPYDAVNTVQFSTVTTDRVRIRIETGEDGPVSWPLVHGAQLYEVSVERH